MRAKQGLAVLGLGGLLAVSLGCGSDAMVGRWAAGKGETSEEEASAAEDAALLRAQEKDFAELAGGSFAREFQDEFDDPLRIELDHAPDTQSFTFCADPISDETNRGLNLTNAAWLGFMAANEYSHLARIAPALRELGFGNRNDDQWDDCALDLRIARRVDCNQEARLDGDCTESCMPFDVTRAQGSDARLEDFKTIVQGCTYGDFSGWEGQCFFEWYKARLDDGDVQGMPHGEQLSAEFEKWLIQTVKEGWGIQFFSGGAFEIERTDYDLDRHPEARAPVTRFKKNSTQAMWAQHRQGGKNIVIVSFRGTEPDQMHDIVNDLLIRRKALNQHGWSHKDWGTVHRGFLRAYKSIEALLLEALKKAEGSPDDPINLWITGHSLGGALATVFSAKVLDLLQTDAEGIGAKIKLKGSYTFGSPRVGNNEFKNTFNRLAAAYGTTLMRFRNNHDVVTRIPKGLLNQGWYYHVGEWLVWLPGKVIEHAADFTGETLNTEHKTLSLITQRDIPWGWASAGDHGMNLYYHRVQELARLERFAKYDQCAD